ncbi:heparinase II/III domain-containing protein [Kineothrix sedimenti]|uniref:Heparinase II/III family protein n=1 Tax=Kineothrix sedimenti TaxID=3123317 RepID=A0ABZ3EUV3_9FIRM
MFFEFAKEYKQSLIPFTPFAPITNREAWNALDMQWRKESIRLGEKYLGFSFPYISASDFMDFLKTGNRVRFESKSFSKRLALSALILAECTENEGRFMQDIINGIFSICEESAWQLPAHNSYIRDCEQLPLPDATSPVLDLFACETGAVLAAAYYLMKNPLDEISPFITKRILSELKHRIFTPYLNVHFWWMGNGIEPMNNWTIWCTQNVLLSVFLTDKNEDIRHDVFLKACESTDHFLAEYEEDGCCDEGAQYYRHAGLCLFNTMEILNAITKGHFAPLYEDTKIQNIASYILNVHIDDKYYVNFADCSPAAGRAGVREYLFARRTGNKVMEQFAADDFKKDLPASFLLSSENNLYYRLQNAFTAAEIKACDTSFPLPRRDIFYPSTGLFIARDERLFLAVKAGDNGDSHNHNDTGSFTVYKDGRPMFIDIGVESYTKKTFSSRRYEIWTMQSAYHNLPTVNGFMQKDGAEYKAKDVICRMEKDICDIEMDISGAYPMECNLLFYKRRAALYKGKYIAIEDSFSAPASQVVISLMSYEKPVVSHSSGGSSVTVSIGTLGKIQIEGGNIYNIEEIPITDPRLAVVWEHEIYRILVIPDKGKLKMLIS